MASNALHGGALVPEPAMVQMYPSGTYVDLLHPDPATIRARDIAHHTGMACRFGGGVSRFYSVAEHASLVADLLADDGRPPELIAAGLLHDAAEAYLGDVTSPCKYALRVIEAEQRGLADAFERDNAAWFSKPPEGLQGVYSKLALRMDRAIGERFGLDPELFDHPAVKEADRWALKIEARLTPSGGRYWRFPDELPNGGELPVGVQWHGGLAPEEAAQRWLSALVDALVDTVPR